MTEIERSLRTGVLETLFVVTAPHPTLSHETAAPLGVASLSLWTPCVEVSCSYGSLCRGHAWLATVHGGRCGPSTCSSALLWEFECVLIMVFTATERLSPTPLRQLGLTRNRGGDGFTEAGQSQTHSWWVEEPSWGSRGLTVEISCPRSGLMSLTGLPSHVGCSHR